MKMEVRREEGESRRVHLNLPFLPETAISRISFLPWSTSERDDVEILEFEGISSFVKSSFRLVLS